MSRLPRGSVQMTLRIQRPPPADVLGGLGTAANRLRFEVGLTKRALAAELDVDESTLKNRLRVVELPPFLLDAFLAEQFRLNALQEFTSLLSSDHDDHVDEMRAALQRCSVPRTDREVRTAIRATVVAGGWEEHIDAQSGYAAGHSHRLGDPEDRNLKTTLWTCPQIDVLLESAPSTDTNGGSWIDAMRRFGIPENQIRQVVLAQAEIMPKAPKPKRPAPTKGLITLAEASKTFDVRVNTLYAWIRRGHLTVRDTTPHPGGRLSFVSSKDVAELTSKPRKPSPKPKH